MKDDAAQAAGLVAKMNALAKSARRVKSYVVFLNGEAEQDALKKLAADKGLLTPLVIPKFPELMAKHLKINPEVRNTLILYKGKKVLRNAVDVTPETFAPLADAARRCVR